MLISEFMNKLERAENALVSGGELEMIPFNEREGIALGEVHDILVDLENNKIIIRLT